MNLSIPYSEFILISTTCPSLTLKSLRTPIPIPIPSFPYFLPSPFPTCCAILPISFGGKGPPFEAMTVRTTFIDGVLAEVFRGSPQP